MPNGLTSSLKYGTVKIFGRPLDAVKNALNSELNPAEKKYWKLNLSIGDTVEISMIQHETWGYERWKGHNIWANTVICQKLV